MKRLSYFLLFFLLVLSACGGPANGPQAWLDSPLNNSAIPLAPLLIIAHASDGNGVSQFIFEVNGASIANVDVNGNRLGEVSIEWTPPEPGVYIITVRAINSNGDTGSMATSRVTVGGSATPTPDALILAETGSTNAEGVETTFANITKIECGADQTVFIDISIGNPQGVLGYSLYSTWADVNQAEVFNDPLPQLVEKRIQLDESIDTVDREHQFTLAVEIPEQSVLLATNLTEPGGRCPGHYQEEVEMAPSDPTAPLVNATQNGNCRSGPSLEYDILSSLIEGQVAEITGRSVDGNWWQIDPGIGGEICWIAGYIVETSGYLGGIAVVAAPPLPVKIITQTPTPTVAAPGDTTPPIFYNTDVSPDSILTDGTGCPGYDRTTTVAAVAADEIGLSYVKAFWNIGGSESGQVIMTEGGLGHWAIIGPVNTVGTMQVYFIAQDTSGNTAQSSTLYVTVQNCVE
ncbi:MAG: Ig-like domain-containing protein [Anaerolineales bacterium]